MVNPLPSPVPAPPRKTGGVTKRSGALPRVNLDGLSEQELRDRVDVWHSDRSMTLQERLGVFAQSGSRPALERHRKKVKRVLLIVLVAVAVSYSLMIRTISYLDRVRGR
jgi:hypothetical protein